MYLYHSVHKHVDDVLFIAMHTQYILYIPNAHCPVHQIPAMELRMADDIRSRRADSLSNKQVCSAAALDRHDEHRAMMRISSERCPLLRIHPSRKGMSHLWDRSATRAMRRHCRVRRPSAQMGSRVPHAVIHASCDVKPGAGGCGGGFIQDLCEGGV